MRSSKVETSLSLAASILMLIGILSKPETFGGVAVILAIGCLIPLFILRRRRRNARLAAGLPPTEKPPRKSTFWLLLLLTVAGSLSGPLWLPYTGVALPTATLVVTSIISCVFAVLVLVLSWRYWNKSVPPLGAAADEKH